MQGKCTSQAFDIKDLQSASDGELCQYAKAGVQAAREILCERNGWIVETLVRRNLARSWQRKFEEKEDEEELRQEGWLAFLKSISKYDPDRKASFSTYAYSRVRKAMQTCYKKKLSCTKELKKHNISFVSYEEICDKQTGENDGFFESEQVSSALNTEREALRNFAIRSVDDAMNDLSKLEEYVCLYLRFGFFPYKEHTRKEVCEIFNWKMTSTLREERKGKKHVRKKLLKNPYAVCSVPQEEPTDAAADVSSRNANDLPLPIYYADACSRRWVQGALSSATASWDSD